MNSNTKIGYVVFSGRKNGVYGSWIDCYAQVNGYKEGVVRVYDTYGEAEVAWENFSKLRPKQIQSKAQIEASIANGPGYVGDILSSISDSYGTFVKEIIGRPDDSLMNLRMQKWLSQACLIMRIHEPFYTLHDKMTVNNKRYYKFRCSLMTDALGRMPVSMGRYASSEEEAREDVAVLMLRRLLSSTGKKLGDYNSHNVELLENQLQKALEANLELKIENATLLVEVEMLRERVKQLELC